MSGDVICGFRLSLYCGTNTGTFCSDPCQHVCSYHGVETDLVNLTACFGHELCKVSSTCTIALETVKAGSLIFLLGVGSYVCYKLYRHYKRRRCPPDSPSRKVSHWISKELLESCMNREEDVLDVKREYFGPDDHSDDNTSGIEFGGLPIFLPNSYCLNKSFVEKLIHKFNAKRMGHANSSSRSHDLVSFNIHGGVNIFQNTSQLPLGLATLPAPASPLPSIVCRSHHQPLIDSSHVANAPKVPRPNSLYWRKTQTSKRSSQKEADRFSSTNRFSQLAAPGEDAKGLDNGSLESEGFLHNWGSSKFYLDDNNEDGDDERDEDEDSLDVTLFNFRKDIDQGSCSGSMKGNFSPGSLLNRHFETFPCENRLTPEGAEVQVDEGNPAKKHVFVVQSSNSASTDDFNSDSEKFEQRDASDCENVGVALSSDSFKTPCNRLVRDLSFSSECSELSIDTSAFNKVGRSTEAKINRIQQEIDDMKKDFQDMESDIGSVDFHGPIPMAYTELVKTTLSDISECSDGPNGESPAWGGGEQSSVDFLKRRAAAKEFISRANISPVKKVLCYKSPESSFDQSSTSSSQLANGSANLSLEWDSMKYESISNSNTSVRLRRKWALASGPINSSMVSNNSQGQGQGQADSGSDFGTPLTNGSPEPASRGRSGSVLSLEWEEEFDPPSSSATDNAVWPPLWPVQENEASQNQKSNQDDESHNSPRKTYANEEHGERCAADSVITESTSNPTVNGKNMWSSIESGYIDEFVESSGSCQITPLTNGDSKLIAEIRKLPNFEAVIANVKHIRTWPVVEKKQEIKEQNGMPKEFVRKCKNLGFHHLRPIYQDAHRFFRAVLLQMLSLGYSPLTHSGGLDHVKRKFSLWMRCHHRWLSKWKFTPKLNYSRENCLQGMLDCLQSLDWLTNCVLNSANKEQSAVDALNTDPETEMQVMEACKLLILKSAVELYEDLKNDRTVPVFALILFSRESSVDPESYMCNHLRCIWDSGGPEEMDLFFLSHAMGVAICVLHPGNDNQDDMITYHPDDKIGSWPEIYLIFKKEERQYCTVLR